MEDFQTQLRKIRQDRQITQAELAQRVGIPQSHLSSIEQGKVDPRVSTLVQIARVLGYEVTLVPREQVVLIQTLIENKEEKADAPLWQPDVEE